MEISEIKQRLSMATVLQIIITP